MGIAGDLAILLIAALIFGTAMQRLRQPLVLGYILAGAAVGPYALGIINNVEEVELLAELGVALLLFTLGIQFSFKQLRPIRNVALLGTPLQVLLTILYGLLLGPLFGWDWNTSIWAGAVLALSNTMVVLKTLSSRGLIGTLSSRVMIGLLIVQDLLAIPLILILPQLSNLGSGLPALGEAALRAGLFMVLMVIAGTRVLPRLMRLAASWNSRELFLLTVTTAALGIGYLTYLFGLSFAFGAFAAGMVISESDYSNQALSDILPLRDLFSMLFFASIGMLLDLAVLLNSLGTVLALTGLAIAGKALIFAVIARSFGYGNIIPIAMGLTMFPLGEFSFVLAREGLQLGVFTPGDYSLLLNTAIITLILTPFVSQLAQPIYRLRRRISQYETLQTFNIPQEGLSDHIIIVGSGRTGEYVARTLQQFEQPFIVIELDQWRFERCKEAGIPVIYGDATQEVVLQSAGIDTAHLLIDTSDSMIVTQVIATHVKRLNPRMHIVARADSIEQMQILHAQGLHEIVQPHFEAGLELARQAMMHMKMPLWQIQQHLDKVRLEMYAPLYVEHPEYPLLSTLQNAASSLTIYWAQVSQESPLVGRSLAELGIRKRTGISVVGIIRDDKLMPNPSASQLFEAGDLVALLGSQDQVNAFEELAQIPCYEGSIDQHEHHSPLQ